MSGLICNPEMKHKRLLGCLQSWMVATRLDPEDSEDSWNDEGEEPRED